MTDTYDKSGFNDDESDFEWLDGKNGGTRLTSDDDPLDERHEEGEPIKPD